jgi:hypothetical protein
MSDDLCGCPGFFVKWATWPEIHNGAGHIDYLYNVGED